MKISAINKCLVSFFLLTVFNRLNNKLLKFFNFQISNQKSFVSKLKCINYFIL